MVSDLEFGVRVGFLVEGLRFCFRDLGLEFRAAFCVWVGFCPVLLCSHIWVVFVGFCIEI